MATGRNSEKLMSLPGANDMATRAENANKDRMYFMFVVLILSDSYVEDAKRFELM